ncbi:unnamed protein product [Rotaria sordida]|uniref:Uncharacterized protein n=1 Tax=Rotaria sordida TaxID=392033 RepID=A0A818YN37_9BILA|nr:unnamed protein product [Rotaria sordida]CAF1131096.1 unnamed protein product [Rotaria sordida]CAF1353884.1 unnamed protein product [Rotaria sordida]CAF3752296.1 unnamed protein product [Rotaria sordida]
MHLTICFLTFLNFGFHLASSDLYGSYTLLYDPLKSSEWSDDLALAYIRTVQLLNYDYHVFQYRPYPCQYFYTSKIEINYNNQTINACIYNTTTSDYEYNFQLHLDFHNIESYILRNIAIQCKYINCSLSLLNVKSIRIDWNKYGRDINFNCSFNTIQQYNIYNAPHILTEWITLRCKSLSACTRSKYNLEQALSSNIQLIYSSTYELEKPYCSLEKNLIYIIETNFSQTNRLLEQLIDLIQRGFGRPNEREQVHMKEYIEHKWIHNHTNTTIDTTAISGEVQGTFKDTKK